MEIRQNVDFKWNFMKVLVKPEFYISDLFFFHMILMQVAHEPCIALQTGENSPVVWALHWGTCGGEV